MPCDFNDKVINHYLTEEEQTMKSRTLNTLVAACFLSVQLLLVPAAQAAMVSTQSVLQIEQRSAQEARIVSALQRTEASNLLAKNGLSVDQVESRLQRLSNLEISQLADRADKIPAGEGALELVLVVFLVLILLDLLGVTDIFPRI